MFEESIGQREYYDQRTCEQRNRNLDFLSFFPYIRYLDEAKAWSLSGNKERKDLVSDPLELGMQPCTEEVLD